MHYYRNYAKQKSDEKTVDLSADNPLSLNALLQKLGEAKV
jgi:hypothetical protein